MLWTPEDIDEPFEVGELEVDGQLLYVPALEIRADGETSFLHMGNTLVRMFYFQPSVNHAELRRDGKLKGVRLPADILEAMIEYKFPMRKDPLVDPQTAEWFTSLELRGLDSELDEL